MTPAERQLVDRACSTAWPRWKTPRAIPEAERADRATACAQRPTPSMRWCRPRWCRTRRSSAPMPASASSKAELGISTAAAAAGRLPRQHARQHLRPPRGAARLGAVGAAGRRADGRASRLRHRDRLGSRQPWAGSQLGAPPARCSRSPPTAGPPRRLVPRHRGGSRGRRDRRRAAARQHPRHDGRRASSAPWRSPTRRVAGGECGGSPWGGSGGGGGDLARQAGSTISAAAQASGGRATQSQRRVRATADDGKGDGDDDDAGEDDLRRRRRRLR